MELTRRDAVVALVGGGVVSAELINDRMFETTNYSLSQEEKASLKSIASVLYPSEVEISEDFVETYVLGRYEWSDENIANLKTALAEVEKASKRRTGSDISTLSESRRGEVLRETGADRAHPDPEGTTAQRIRYYVINDLLYALYSTEKGGKLAGNPNPPGHPGGIEGKQR